MPKKKKPVPQHEPDDAIRAVVLAEIERQGLTSYAVGELIRAAGYRGPKQMAVWRYTNRKRDLVGATLANLLDVLGLEVRKKES